MFEFVVVGIDGRSGGRDALALARELGDAGARLVLANTYIAGTFPARGNAGVFTGGQLEEAERVLEQTRADAGVDADLAPVASPYVGRGLHELAEDIKADLIVVGSSRRGLIGRVLQGGDMQGALNGAPCAVAIAPNGYARRPHALSEVGVGYDGTPESTYALEVARSLATRHGARLSAFEAVAVQAAHVDSGHASQQTLDDMVTQATERLRQLDGVEPHAAYGAPAEELALYAASVDLLVVGSRGYGPLGRLVHGSTSRQLAGSARCPLVVVTRPPTAAPKQAPAAGRKVAATS